MSATVGQEPTSSPGPSDADDPLAGWGFWLIAVFLYAVTLYAAWLSFERHQLVEAAPRFTMVRGEVKASAVKARGGTSEVSASIVVGYEVDGHGYELHTNGLDGKIGGTDHSGSAAFDANSLSARFSVGSSVPVYFDPHAPEVSALSAEVEGGRGLGTTLGAFALSLGYSLWLWRRRRSRPSQ